MTKFIENYAATISQMFFVASAVFSGLGFPYIFGVEAYGAFVGAATLTLIVQRLTDLMIEPLIGERDPRKLIIIAITSFALAVLASLALRQIDSSYQINLLLLLSLLSSTVVLNLIFQSRDQILQLIYSIVFFFGLVLTSVLVRSLGSENITIVLTITGFLGALIGLMCIHMRRTPLNGILKKTQNRAIHHSNTLDRILFSSLSITLLYLAPLIASHKLNNFELGHFRIYTSLAFLGYWLTPISPKLFYTLGDQLSTPAGIRRLLIQHRYVMWALLSGWFFVLVFLREFPQSWSGPSFVGALCLYPAGLCFGFFDKSQSGSVGLNRISKVSAIFAGGTAIAMAIATTNLQLQIIVAFSILLFPLALAKIFRPNMMLFTVLPILASALGFVVLFEQSPIVVTVLALAFVLGVGLFFRKSEIMA